MQDNQDILRLEGFVKVYPNGVVANDNAYLSVRKGEIHALAGENGAGKSTLMKMLFGLEQPTEGHIWYKGQEIHIKNPLEAIGYGLGMVHQHFMLVESMTVAENICLGSESVKHGFLDLQDMFRKADEIIQQYHFTINPRERIRDLPIGTRQKVEILKALFKGAQVLILDEPTAVLTPQETEELFRELKGLRDMGHTIIFISHKLNEIKELCDRITIMRAGKTVGVYDVASVSQEDISNLMVGKNMDWSIDKPALEPGNPVLELERVNYVDELHRHVLKDVSFKLRASSILGIVGVEGNGQSELVNILTGLKKNDSGTVRLFGEDIAGKTIKEIRAMGEAHIPQDRLEEGVAADSSIEDNLFAIYTEDSRFRKGILLDKKARGQWAEELVKDYGVKADSASVPVKMLSGGNMQKVVVAREFSKGAGCIIANQPTRGIDVGAAGFIHRKLIEMRSQGVAVLLISADLAEVMTLSDSLMVICGGRIVAYFADASKVSEEALGKYMLGLEEMSEEEVAKCAL